MKNFNNYYPSSKDKLLNNGNRLFQLQATGFEGCDTLIDGIPQRVLIQEHTNTITDNDDKKLMCLQNVQIKRGSVIETIVDKENYLVMASVRSNKIYKTAKIKHCNTILKWQTPTGEIISQPCIVANYSLYNDGVKEDKLVSFPDGKINIVVPNNAQTKLLDRGKRIVLNNEAVYEISLPDAYSKVGLISFILTEDLTHNPGDRLDLGIADYFEPQQPSLITGVDIIKYNRTETYTVDTPSTFEIVYGSTPTNALAFTVLSSTSCSIKALKYPYTITLRATNNSTGTVVEKQIQLVSLF